MMRAFLSLFAVLTSCYIATSIYIARRIAYRAHVLPTDTPASLGLQYREVIFPSRKDHVQLQGWFIPGVLPNNFLTSQRTIIMVHGTWQNRTDKDAGLLDLSGKFARLGFAVLAFDMRGMGESPSSPLTFGAFEQYDVLGAVDFLRTGILPYPELGRPQSIVGWGISMGAATLLLAAAQEPAILAVVADSSYANIHSVIKHKFRQMNQFLLLFIPGILLASRTIYGINYSSVRPQDIVARIAPRPIFFIHGACDDWIPPMQMTTLAQEAKEAPNAHIKTWLVPGAKHAQAYHTEEDAYVEQVVTFYTSVLG